MSGNCYELKIQKKENDIKNLMFNQETQESNI